MLFARSWRIDYPYSIDFQVYWLAGHRVATGEAPLLYEPGGGLELGLPLVMPGNELKNLPLVAAAFVPFSWLPYLAAKRLLWWIGVASLLGTAFLLGRFVLPPAIGGVGVRAALAAAVVCSAAPAHATLRHGQTTAVVLLVLTGYLTAQLRRREALAGVLLASAGVVKIPVLALAALDALRRRFRAFGAWLAVTAGIVAVSLAAFGPAIHARYLDGLAQHAGTVMTGHNNQSVAAVVHRVTEGGDVYAWEPLPLSGRDRWATALVTALLGLALAYGLLSGRSTAGLDSGRFLLEFPAVLAFGIVAMPVAWDHYFLLLVPGIVCVAVALRDRGLLARPIVGAAVVVAFALLAFPTPQRVLDRAAAWGLPGALVLSHYFLGAALVLGLAVLGLRGRSSRQEAHG